MEDDKSKISIQDLESLLKRVQERKLSEQDFKLLIRLLEFYQNLIAFLKGKSFNIFRLKNFFSSLFATKK